MGTNWEHFSKKHFTQNLYFYLDFVYVLDFGNVNDIIIRNYFLRGLYERVGFQSRKIAEKMQRLLGRFRIGRGISENMYTNAFEKRFYQRILVFYRASGTKVRHFRSNGKAGVTFYYGGDSVTLTGDMTIVSDKTIKDSLWQDFLEKHFPNGGKDDEEYCVLHFVAKQATIYVEEEFETIEI